MARPSTNGGLHSMRIIGFLLAALATSAVLTSATVALGLPI
jgi:hypothetical protein